jgi:hypothetical protein
MSGPLIFDRQLLRMRRRRAELLVPADFLLARVAEEMTDRLGGVLRQFELAADIGTPGDHLRKKLLAGGKVGQVIGVDPLAGPLPARSARRPPQQAGEV